MGVGIGLEMIRQIENDTSEECLYKFEKDVFLLFGDKDKQTVQISNYLKKCFVSSRTNITYSEINGSNHLFTKFDHINEVFDRTIKWVNNRIDERNHKYEIY